MDLYLPSLPSLGDDLGVNTTLAQLTMTACTLGLGLGQILVGPLSDKFGRRRPIILGVLLFALMSLACTVAPNIGFLVTFRFIQGLGGAAGMVVARAMVRDMYEGQALTRMFSLLMLVSGSAPIIAPILGGQLVRVVDWRGVFLVLFGIGAALFVIALLGVKETLPKERRQTGGFRAIGVHVTTVAKDGLFVAVVLVLGCTTASFMSYITMTSFIFQDEFGTTPTEFSIIFTINSVAIVLGSQLNGFLARRFSSFRLLGVALAGALLATLAVLDSAVMSAPLVALCASLAAVLFFQGWVNPNTTSIAMQDHGAHAGTASALLGTAQFVVGPLIGPLVSLGGASSLALGVTMVSCLALANVLWYAVVRPIMRKRLPGTGEPEISRLVN